MREHRLTAKLTTDTNPEDRHTILLVEDNPVNQTVALRMLEKLGLRADLAQHGAEAVEALGGQRYDIIFMDIHMPIMDGFEAARHIRALYPDSPPYIIAVTANVSQECKRKCREAGMTDYLHKPLSLDRLAEAIARALA